MNLWRGKISACVCQMAHRILDALNCVVQCVPRARRDMCTENERGTGIIATAESASFPTVASLNLIIITC